MSSIEERFRAAVNVIKGLPKNGPYQPSTSMMLKFYGYYKQATEGVCAQKKPAFWDVVGKAKWDAWKTKSHLTKQQAMEKYVENLREIIETMSFNDSVADFVGSLSDLDSINLDELDLIAPGMREIAESHPNSPFNSRTNSPQHGASSNPVVPQDEENSVTAPSVESSATASLNGHVLDADVDAEHIMIAPSHSPHTKAVNENTTTTNYSVINSVPVDQSDDEYGDPIDIQRDVVEAVSQNAEILKQIHIAVLRVNTDLLALKHRMHTLERNIQDVRMTLQHKASLSAVGSRTQRWPKWWPFRNISPAWFALLILWPFLVKRLSLLLALKRRK